MLPSQNSPKANLSPSDHPRGGNVRAWAQTGPERYDKVPTSPFKVSLRSVRPIPHLSKVISLISDPIPRIRLRPRIPPQAPCRFIRLHFSLPIYSHIYPCPYLPQGPSRALSAVALLSRDVLLESFSTPRNISNLLVKFNKEARAFLLNS